MNELIVLDGDQLVFNPMFGHRQVIPSGPAVIRGTGKASVQSRRMCILGDEKKVQIQAQYLVPGHSPGAGMITIMALAGNQQAPRCTAGAGIILKGQFFDARFTPTQPAMPPSGPPDPMAPSMGKGQFIPRQAFATAKS